jgi:hypothetical protein
MKTGRVRRKAEPPEEQADVSQPPPPVRPPSKASGSQPPTNKPHLPTGVWIAGGLFVVLACVVIAIVAFGGKKADQWVPATGVTGEWTTTTTLFGPQVTTQEMWETACTATPNAAVRSGTCLMKDTESYRDTVVDEYDEYAFDIYYEETYSQIYEAQGTEFVPVDLKTDEWWQENLHYNLQEELDQESCQYTDYTIWVDDPQDKTQEIEVYLSDCEVWDHVTVTERVYDQKAWCQCDVTDLVQMGQQSEQGTGSEVRWPNPSVPAGGRAERSFKGQATFRGDDYSYTSTTQDLDAYQSYMTEDYYIGLKDGKPVAISKEPPQK